MPQRILNLSFGSYPISPFHPKAPAYQRLTLSCAVQGQLLSVNPDMSFSAGLLKSVRRKGHGKTYELELQEDLVFYNCRKVLLSMHKRVWISLGLVA
jgi:hypothetical protein